MTNDQFFAILKLSDNERLAYLQSLFPLEDGTVETDEDIAARELRLEEFEAAILENKDHPDLRPDGILTCIFKCAKKYMDCRKNYPNYPAALQCDEEAVNCFIGCYTGGGTV